MKFSENTEDLVHDPKYISWKKEFEKSGCRVHKAKAVKLVLRNNGKLLFGLIHTHSTDPQNKPILPLAFLRGDAVVIVPSFKILETGEQRFLMVVQRRVGNGHASLEFPAGMLDEKVDSPLEVAVREMQEETGIKISEKDLVSLSDKPLYSSPGLSDEAIHFYAVQKEIKQQQFLELQGKSGGNPEESEFITLCWKTGEEIEKETTSLQVRLALYLFWNKYSAA